MSWTGNSNLLNNNAQKQLQTIFIYEQCAKHITVLDSEFRDKFDEVLKRTNWITVIEIN